MVIHREEETWLLLLNANYYNAAFPGEEGGGR